MDGEQPRKGTEFVCEVCGTTLVVTNEGVGLLENIVCCERPMESRKIKHRHKSKAKRPTTGPSKRKKGKR